MCVLTLALVLNISNVTLAENTKKVKEVNKKIGVSTSRVIPKNAVKINSEAAILMDLNTGKILYSKNIHEKLQPASTTKILTAIIALESGSLDRTVTVGKGPTLVEPTKIGLKLGEKIKLKYLLYALLVDSANDAAVAIAEYVGGSTANFAKIMNKKAKALGCTDSNFVNPNGLPNSKHLTTAYDLAMITKYAMKNSNFKTIVGTITYKIPATNKHASRSLINHNKMMLKSTDHYYSGCIGVKTGYTIASKHTLVSAAVRGKQKLLAIVLKDTAPYVYTDIITMFNYEFNKKSNLKELHTYKRIK